MFHSFSHSQFKKFIVGKRNKYRCRICAFLHSELGVGDMGNKEQGIAAFSKMLRLGILVLQHLSLVSLKGEILDITANEEAIPSLEVQSNFIAFDCSGTIAG